MCFGVCLDGNSNDNDSEVWKGCRLVNAAVQSERLTMSFAVSGGDTVMVAGSGEGFGSRTKERLTHCLVVMVMCGHCGEAMVLMMVGGTYQEADCGEFYSTW